MQLQVKRERFLEIMVDFYELTGIRMVLFDSGYNEILAYPNHRCDFCTMMHHHPITKDLCLESDRYSFERCRLTKGLVLYQCHAGLVEATVPLFADNIIVGYMMIGQIADMEGGEDIYTKICSRIPVEFFDRNKLMQSTFSIMQTTDKKIRAASRILEVSTHYILGENLVKYRKETFIRRLDEYIEEHIAGTLTPQTVSGYFGISRSKLYELSREHLDIGIAEYVKIKRLDYSRKLLGEADISVTQLAELAGFSDYNYFCRCYRSRFGVSPKKDKI